MLLDTNALLLPFRSGLILADAVDRVLPGSVLAVPSSVLGELDRLTARDVPHASAARALALTLRILPTRGRGDAAVISLAVAERACVVTADRALADRLGALGVSVLRPRDRTQLELHRGRRPDQAGRGPPGAGRAALAAVTVKKRTRLERGRAFDARRRPPARPPGPRVRGRRRRRL